GDIQTAIVLEETATLKDLVITATDAIAIWDEGDSNADSQIRNCTIRNSRTGISSVNASSLQIMDNYIIDNQASGIELFNNVTPTLINNLISNNGVGITVFDNSLPSFKISTSGSGNRILGNKSCDLRHQGNLTIDTIGTIWDDAVFNFTIASNCSQGENIVIEGVGSANFQFIPNPDTPVFANTTQITTNSPQFGELLFVQKPSFSWQYQGDGILAIVVMDQPPGIDSNGIVNRNHIVWIWHSGLPTTTPNSVDFDDGRALDPPYDNFKNVSAAAALQKGRSYYWSVLQWDSQTSTVIVASSALNYFLTSN
ncbi:MAG: right-handed parallel beta-helix repeat-containing protein, partial [Thiohalomonadales bacterium]